MSYNNSASIILPKIVEAGTTLTNPQPNGGGFFPSNLDISTFYRYIVKDYAQYRRLVRSLARLNYLQYIGFDFGRCSFITFTISDDFIADKKAIDNAIERIEEYFKRQGVRYYIVAKEFGELTDRLHFHFMVFRAPYFVPAEVVAIWKIGKNIDFKEITDYKGGVVGGVAYLAYYLKKGLNLQFSRGFFIDGLLRNDVYYLVKYDKNNAKVYIDNVFDAPFVSKDDYRIFKGRLSSSELALGQLRLHRHTK